jgi:NhaP-type Na+/H+ or K+/H+ antiporter
LQSSGGIVIARLIDHVTWPALLYAVLSLTVIRMLPVFLFLVGTRTSTANKLFFGWFGPRGLATIVFASLVLDEKLPGNDTIMRAASWTVPLSVIAQGCNRQPACEVDSEALGRATRPDGRAGHRLQGSRIGVDPPV